MMSTLYPTLVLTSNSFRNAGTIPEKYAHCRSDGLGKAAPGENISPELSWGHAPLETQSFALLVVDPDVPSDFTDANKDGKVIPAFLPRQDFYHWALVDIPKDVSHLAEGVGKIEDPSRLGVQGANDYGTFLGGEDNRFLGYDGPCPPWNDERLHHYHFRLYALDVETLGLSRGFNPRQLQDLFKGHVLAMGEWVGTYSLFRPMEKK